MTTATPKRAQPQRAPRKPADTLKLIHYLEVRDQIQREQLELEALIRADLRKAGLL